MFKLIRFKSIKVVAILLMAIVIAITGLPALSAQTPSDTPSEDVGSNPQANEQDLENLQAEDDFYSQLPPNIQGVVTEDPFLYQLAKWTNTLAETDSTVGTGFEDLVVKGVVVEQDGEDLADPVTPGDEGEPTSVLELPSIPQRVSEITPGILRAELDEGNFYIQATTGHGVYEKGVRVLMEVNQATKQTFRFPLNVPEGEQARVLESDQVLFSKTIDGEEIPTRLIYAPWAIDADGNELPVSQSISEGYLIVAVDARGAVLPVIVDPKSRRLDCSATGGTISSSREGSAGDYLYGRKCPYYSSFIGERGYFPELMQETWNRYRVVNPGGGCSFPSIPVAVSFPIFIPIIFRVKPPDKLRLLWPIGTVWDFKVACKAHDYCYDLIRINLVPGSGLHAYPNVRRATCDNLFSADLFWDCQHRKGYRGPICRGLAFTAVAAVRAWSRIEGESGLLGN